MTEALVVPEFTRGDRMRITLRQAGVSVSDMAVYLGVGRNTVSTWLNDRITPSTSTLRLWAIRCGVPFEWLRDGPSSQRVRVSPKPVPFTAVAA